MGVVWLISFSDWLIVCLFFNLLCNLVEEGW